MSSRVIRVAVNAPLPGLFDYLPAERTPSQLPSPGSRVLVPFGRGRRIGVVWSREDQQESPYRLKRLIRVLDETPLLDENLRELLEWCAAYYHHPLGEVVSAAIPVRLRQEKGLSNYREPHWRLEATCPDPGEIDARAKLQQAVVSRLADVGGAALDSELRSLDGDVQGALKRLEEKGWVTRELVFPGAENIPSESTGAQHQLNAEQQAAVERIEVSAGNFTPLLLEGVTGSGKTEVYIRAAEHAIQQGKQVIVLAPEIALTPQLVARFEQGIAAPGVEMHSGLADGEREKAWQAMHFGDARLLIGTRSAIFASAPDLGLVIVDEEHDQSYKQQEGFRYSARDVAVMRAKQLAIPIVLGSATPSLETMLNADEARYQRLQLKQRAGNARRPTLEAVDIRKQHLHGGLSARLIEQTRQCLAGGEQVILFLNRRGYAPQLTCDECGWIAECSHCDARMTFHAATRRLWCHHCGYQLPAPGNCPDCSSDNLVYLGQGTERLEETLGGLFPDVSLVRIDRDTTRRKGNLEAHLEQMRGGEPGILIGTQMVAKGHDFPNVTLVGILNLDQGLLHPDFRSPERTAQLLLQVAGRAGRGEKQGHVIVQTRHPENPLLQQLLKDDYQTFSASALEERKESHFPPYTYQALLRAESTSQERTWKFLETAAEAAAALLKQVEIWGPVPAPMERKAGHFRGHLLLQSDARATLHAHLDFWLEQLRKQEGASSVRWSLDIDPQEQL